MPGKPLSAAGRSGARCREDRIWPLLLGVWLFAFAVRCFYIWQIRHAPFFDLRIGDGEAYHLWAQRIAARDWLGEGVFYQAPLYPYFLAAIYRLFNDSAATVRLIQAALGAASCALLATAGISLFGRRGAIAGIALAIYPPAIFLDGLLEKSPLVTFFTTALLALLSAPPERMSARRWFATGAILGLLALTRENALLLSIALLVWLALGPFQGPWRERARPAALFLAGCALVLLPVGFRNLAVGGEFHLTTSQFGPNFYIGNHAGATGTYEALVLGHGSAVDERADAIRLAEQAAGRKLLPAEVSNYWTGRALHFIRAHPIDWLTLAARKFALTFHSGEIADTESPEVFAEWSWLLIVLRPFDFGLLFAMAALGVVLTAPRWRRLWFLYAIAVTYTFSVVLFYVFTRYRFPVVPVLMLLAAGGVLETIAAARSHSWRTLAPAAVAAIVALALSNLPLETGSAARATNYFGIAAALARQPERSEEAMQFYQRALNAAPGFPAAQVGMATLLTHMGRPEESLPHFRMALAAWPDDEEARYNFGIALAAAGKFEEALHEYGEALRIRPDDADAHFAMAKILIAANRPDLAVTHYRQGLSFQPQEVAALVGLGVALTQLDRPEEAIREYQIALQLDPADAAAHNNLGWTLANQGRISEAVPHFERALAINPRYENARVNLDQARRLLQR
jgi:tetratricopeptide (TPR) repeat protein